MTQSDIDSPLRQMLMDLEFAMREAELWSSNRPTVQALASQMPFCCDTLAFEQWLQFIFLPQLSMMLDNKLPLPGQSAILPMAEESLSQGGAANRVLKVIGHIDNWLNHQHVDGSLT